MEWQTLYPRIEFMKTRLWPALKKDDLIPTKKLCEQMQAQIASALQAACKKAQIILDPGIGFGKGTQQNLQIIKDCKDFVELGYPLLIGASRKNFIGEVLNLSTEERIEGSIVSNVLAFQAGAQIFRVHDVKENKRALEFSKAIYER